MDHPVIPATEVMIETANPEQAAAWNGREGEHWSEHADRFDAVGASIWQRFLERDLVARADQVLDVGCGTGKSARDLARIATEGSVTGVDLSAPMLAVARARSAAERLTNVTYVQADAQIHPFAVGGFDVAVSCFGAMFFADPVAAFTNIGAAIRPDGMLALLAWRALDRNEWITAIRAALAVGRELPVPPPDAPTPFSLAEPARVRAILTAAGFDQVGLEPIDEPVVLGTDAEDAYGFLRTMGIVEWLIDELPVERRARALQLLRSTVEAHETPGAVVFGSSAWLITARRRRSNSRT